MTTDELFRVAFALVLATNLAISATYRRRARRAAGAIPRTAESPGLILLRLAVTLPLLWVMVAYLARPAWVAWASAPLPAWLRWIGVGIGLGTIPLAVWVFRSLGTGVSETTLTRPDHRLVTHGPYRSARHPLYTTGLLLLLGLGLTSANLFILACALAGPFLFGAVIVPREEAALIARFGDTYRQYMQRTGRFAPRLRRRAPR